ncbi:hypothetical protein J2W28_000980 [Variovorax boronicumulans]|uniref:hypothetical protein n=1 Tax=Variovorax boronicumulans TaxID=436515 RepID=UPI00277E74FF|nr:hypothetical protein [Variovorax boronicumulans]MDP9991952.1 hypothetical protein [Variovorax boronicumulans]MDQ0001847.1 hypothetical protein [Variovorax boronicumulans]
MTLDEITRTAIEPALHWLPVKMNTIEARVEMLTIGLQESNFEHRYQVLNDPKKKGPARSFWQGEQGGGMVAGAMSHPASQQLARAACTARSVPFTTRAVWEAIENDDVLAAILARLLLWTEPGALPRANDAAGGWALYLRAWRPGAYERGSPDDRATLRMKWERNHRAARAFLGLP